MFAAVKNQDIGIPVVVEIGEGRTLAVLEVLVLDPDIQDLKRLAT